MGSGTNITQIWSRFIYEQWKMLLQEDRQHFLKAEKIFNENRGQEVTVDNLVPDSFILYVRDKFEEESKILALRYYWQSVVLMSDDKAHKAGRDAWLQYAVETLSTPIDLGHDIRGPNMAFGELHRLEGERNRQEDWTIENSILFQLSNLRRIFGLIAGDLPVALNLDWELAQIAPSLRELEFLVMSQPTFNMLVGLIIYESILRQRDEVPATMRMLNLPERYSEGKFPTLFDLGAYWTVLMEMREGEWHGRQFLDDAGRLTNPHLREFLSHNTGLSDFGDLRRWEEQEWAKKDVRSVRLFVHALQVYLNSRGGARGSPTMPSDPSSTTPAPTASSGASAAGVEVVDSGETFAADNYFVNTSATVLPDQNIIMMYDIGVGAYTSIMGTVVPISPQMGMNFILPLNIK